MTTEPQNKEILQRA